MAINQRMGRAEWAMLLGLSVLWGTSFLFVGVAVRALPPFSIVAARLAGASAVLWAVALGPGVTVPREARLWRAFAAMGLLNNVLPFCLIVWGQRHVASGVAAILNAATPLFTALAAHLLTPDERLSRLKLLGIVVGFGGVAVMMGVDATGGDVLSKLTILCAPVSYAFAAIYGRRFRALGVSPLATATGQVTASAALLLPVAALADAPWTLPMPGLPVLGALGGLAVLSTAGAYVLYFRILARAGATNAGLVTLLVPVSANLFGVTLLGEHLRPRHAAGMALIALGLAAIDGRLFRRRG